LVEGDPFYLKFWVNQPPLKQKADFKPIFARSTTAVKSTYVALIPPTGASKMLNG